MGCQWVWCGSRSGGSPAGLRKLPQLSGRAVCGLPLLVRGKSGYSLGALSAFEMVIYQCSVSRIFACEKESARSTCANRSALAKPVDTSNISFSFLYA